MVITIGKVMRNQGSKEGTGPREKLLPKSSIQSTEEVPQSKDLGGGECVQKGHSHKMLDLTEP